ncbi:TPA: diguanylate cyclase [Vibrio vulnificus]|nr:diguanylate cyclase [Vibrio vulnificus NBRC 15645 = ATCC 27562]EGQ7998351.1 GGDEF domain-containing protein [Vibrio vulnificus]ELF6470382.1 GGDEF domain-containing protein [Vibrio vulnificus]MCL7018247.1 GGDEF domain-containing protein [Vibrio vulnificus]QET76708.1 GGDEF domain-containing protein [Vibrio vulnificus]
MQCSQRVLFLSTLGYRMRKKRQFSRRFVVLFPALIFFTVMFITVKNYYDSVNRNIAEEYDRINTTLTRSIKILTALEYSFSSYTDDGYSILSNHNAKIENGLCSIWPIDPLLRAEGKVPDQPEVDINYMLVGVTELCEVNSGLNVRVSNKSGFAPSLSFLHDIEPFMVGILYLDKHGYAITSPDSYAASFSLELLDTLKARPFWQKTANSPGKVTFTGPGYDLNLGRVQNESRYSLSIPVFEHSEHQGMLMMTLDSHVLLQNKKQLGGQIHLANLNFALPDNALLVTNVELPTLDDTHALYYGFSWKKELQNFVSYERYSVIAAVFIYLLSTFTLFLVNTRTERQYFKELATRDPMTGLLNRRGMQAVWRNKISKKKIALAVFDIDDFKAINDTYGHDVGDEAIKLVASCIRDNIRQCDVASRFGGEEFVITLYGDECDGMEKVLARVREAVNERSPQVVRHGFTISAGVVIREMGAGDSFDALFKAADDSLYQAKTSGKDKIVYCATSSCSR